MKGIIRVDRNESHYTPTKMDFRCRFIQIQAFIKTFITFNVFGLTKRFSDSSYDKLS